MPPACGLSCRDARLYAEMSGTTTPHLRQRTSTSERARRNAEMAARKAGDREIRPLTFDPYLSAIKVDPGGSGAIPACCSFEKRLDRFEPVRGSHGAALRTPLFRRGAMRCSGGRCSQLSDRRPRGSHTARAPRSPPAALTANELIRWPGPPRFKWARPPRGPEAWRGRAVPGADTASARARVAREISRRLWRARR